MGVFETTATTSTPTDNNASRPSSSGCSNVSIRSLSAGYSPRQNYSQGRAKPRKAKEQSRSTSTGRFEKRSGSQLKGKQPVEQQTFKDVCLLPSPGYNTAPRMRAKAELIGKGLYIDAWTFNKTCTEDELKTSITALFNDKLISDDGDEVE